MYKKSLDFFVVLGFVTLFFVLYLPSPAFANAGTPLMWAGFFHLFIGNAIIGLIEGFIISYLFKTKKILSIILMVIANYASMFLGLIFMKALDSKIENIINIYNIFYAVIMLIIFCYLITLIIEWPFCFILFAKQEKRIGKSFRAIIIANAISYILLILFYWSFSGTSLISGTKIDKSLAFAKNDKIWVYYVSSTDGDKYRTKLNASSIEKIKDEKYAHFFVHPTNNVDLRLEAERDWDVHVGFWAIEGLLAKNKKTGQHFRIALDTPLIAWFISNLTILPDDQVVFQLGENQIILLDLNSRKMGLIAKGKSPVVIIENK